MAHQYLIYNDPNEDLEDDLLAEYDLSSMKAKSNPYAAQAARRQSLDAITSEADIAEVFKTMDRDKPDSKDADR